LRSIHWDFIGWIIIHRIVIWFFFKSIIIISFHGNVNNFIWHIISYSVIVS